MEEYKEAAEQAEEAEKRLNEYKSQHYTGGPGFGGWDSSESQNEGQKLDKEYRSATNEAERLNGELGELNDSLDTQSELIDNLEGQLDGANEQAQGTVNTLRDWVDTTAELNTDRWSDDLRSSFVSNFEAMGLSLQDFQGLSQQALSDISMNYDGSMKSLLDILSKYSGDIENEGVKAMLGYYNGLSDGMKQKLIDSESLTIPVLQALSTASTQFGITGDQAAQYYLQGINEGALSNSSSAEDISNYIAGVMNNPEAYKNSGAVNMQSFTSSLSSASIDALKAANALNETVINALSGAASEYGISGDQAVQYYIQGLQSGALNSSSTGAQIAAYIASQIQNDGASQESGESLSKKLSLAAFNGLMAEADANGPATGAYMMHAVASGMNPDGTFAEKADLGAQEYSYELGGNAVLTEDGVKMVDTAASGATPNGQFGLQALSAVSEYLGSLVTGNEPSYGAMLRDGVLSGTYPNGLFVTSGQEAGSEYSSGVSSQEGAAASAGSVVAAAANVALKGSNLFALAGMFAGTKYASGLSSTSSLASASGSTLANAARSSLSNGSSYAYNSGRNLGMNFANGIRSAYGAVASAASMLANAAAAFLHHSTPEKGPLKDDDVWGLHLAQNIADGMKRGSKYVANASAELASAVVEPVASWGPVDPGINRYSSSSNVAGTIADAVLRMVNNYEENPNRDGVYIENQNFSTRVVRSDEDMYTVAPIIFRNATREARLMGRGR